MTRLPVAAARKDFADLVNRVAYGGERLVIVRRGKDVAAVVPVEDLQLLEELIEAAEDKVDLREARKALRERGASVNYASLRRELGLK
jgi:prevent-host-death family protein